MRRIFANNAIGRIEAMRIILSVMVRLQSMAVAVIKVANESSMESPLQALATSRGFPSPTKITFPSLIAGRPVIWRKKILPAVATFCNGFERIAFRTGGRGIIKPKNKIEGKAQKKR